MYEGFYQKIMWQNFLWHLGSQNLADFCTSWPFLLSMSDKSKNCPVCSNVLKEHTAQELIYCIDKLLKEKPSNYVSPTLAKNQEALKVINELIENYEINLDMYMTSDQPDNYFMTKQTIDDLEKIKRALT